MGTEIERKFLVAHDEWQAHVMRKQHIRDGLIAFSPARKVRVRTCDDRATLTIKAKTAGIADAEYEYDIPLHDAEELLRTQCDDNVLSKTRHYVPSDGLMWEIDVYEGTLQGVVLAEVELPKEDTPIALPPWVGPEVTGLPQYKKINMLRARKAHASEPPL